MLDNSTNIIPYKRREFRHNKRRICKQSAKRAGQENDLAGNSWNTSNFNIWEDWSLEYLSGPGSELHRPFLNIMLYINILILHAGNGFSIKCSSGFYMGSILQFLSPPFIHIQFIFSACSSSYWYILRGCSLTGNLITLSSTCQFCPSLSGSQLCTSLCLYDY